ncbi:MAG: hypothetical protein EX341_07060 [Candidatus Scalindua sp. SCAELEC01]|nr:MAG: hypothetical protein DWQ00_02475 [Candidatus Scalindua sp.]NOG83993.1 hypothetical protein [Planctomycetota bacterium]RZV88061.1 MAG: hypothetical protein EX341_07060 [Candidatus Scalindua sp. SCAELEC01]
MTKKVFKSKRKINDMGVTNDTLVGRGGMNLFVKYLSSVDIYPLLEGSFGNMRKSQKGLPVWNIFKQIFCWFYDGTSRHLNYFDKLKVDEGYASAIENGPDEMASSHQIKRFYKSFSWVCGGQFRKILRKMFIWRLRLEKPDVIDLTIDTMVMDNNEALKRYGVQPTYKKVKGFQPLQAIWNGKIVDAIFRGGKKHSNYGNSVVNMIRGLVQVIRKEYRETVTIIVRLDSGFFDEKILRECDKLGIGFICTGKMYKGVKEYVGVQPQSQWKSYSNRNQEWEYLEEVMPVGSYATTVRRNALDFAAKIIGTGGQLILKVNQIVMDTLRFDILWLRSQTPIPIVI